MTKQITIKLNEKRFKPLIESLIESNNRTSKSYSEAVGKAIFYSHQATVKKHHELGNKTIQEKICELREITKEQCQIEFLRAYSEFTSKH